MLKFWGRVRILVEPGGLLLLMAAFVVQPALANMALKTVKFESKLAKQNLEINVYLPRGYAEESTLAYPVLLTTAGGSRLPMLTTQVDWLSHVNFGPMPKVIVVTLPDIDLPEKGDKFAAASGALDKLTVEVLSQELLPYIDKMFRTQPYRLIEGFSSWGNFPLYVFRYQPQLFNAYLVFSPALELDKSGLVESFTDFEVTKDYRNRFLFVSVGDLSGNGKRKDQDFLALETSLMPHAGRLGLTLHFSDLRDRNYIATPVIGLNQGVSALFADRAPDMRLFDESGYRGLKAYFQELASKYGYALDSNSAAIDLSFYYLGQGKKERALDTMAQIVDLTSENIILLLRLASVEAEAGNKAKARKTLNRALTVAREKQDQEAQNYIQNQINRLASE